MKLLSDGTAIGTKILVDGKELENVMVVSFKVDASDGLGRLTLVCYADEVDVEVDTATVETVSVVRPQR